MSASYLAIAFTLGVLARYGFKEHRNALLSGMCRAGRRALTRFVTGCIAGNDSHETVG
jgi:hypothetical protein